MTQFSSNNLPKQLAGVCSLRSFKSLRERYQSVTWAKGARRHFEREHHRYFANVLTKKIREGFKGAVYRATSISVAALRSYAKRFKDFM